MDYLRFHMDYLYQWVFTSHYSSVFSVHVGKPSDIYGKHFQKDPLSDKDQKCVLLVSIWPLYVITP